MGVFNSEEEVDKFTSSIFIYKVKWESKCMGAELIQGENLKERASSEENLNEDKNWSSFNYIFLTVVKWQTHISRAYEWSTIR